MQFARKILRLYWICWVFILSFLRITVWFLSPFSESAPFQGKHMARENSKAETHQFSLYSVYPGNLSEDTLWLSLCCISRNWFFPPERPKHRPSMKVHYYSPRVVMSLITWTSFWLYYDSIWPLDRFIPSPSKYQHHPDGIMDAFFKSHLYIFLDCSTHY